MRVTKRSAMRIGTSTGMPGAWPLQDAAIDPFTRSQVRMVWSTSPVWMSTSATTRRGLIAPLRGTHQREALLLAKFDEPAQTAIENSGARAAHPETVPNPRVHHF